MRKFTIAFIVCAIFSGGASAAGDYSNTCRLKSCPAGSAIHSDTTRQDPAYACTTKEITEYANFVMGLVLTQKALTGTLPNISPQTGEPEYDGETAKALYSLRSKAGVRTFDEATAKCRLLDRRVKLTVANSKPGEKFLWAFDKKNESLWYPTIAVAPNK